MRIIHMVSIDASRRRLATTDVTDATGVTPA
jgi:hypothetical protein